MMENWRKCRGGNPTRGKIVSYVTRCGLGSTTYVLNRSKFARDVERYSPVCQCCFNGLRTWRATTNVRGTPLRNRVKLRSRPYLPNHSRWMMRNTTRTSKSLFRHFADVLRAILQVAATPAAIVTPKFRKNWWIFSFGVSGAFVFFGNRKREKLCRGEYTDCEKFSIARRWYVRWFIELFLIVTLRPLKTIHSKTTLTYFWDLPGSILGSWY